MTPTVCIRPLSLSAMSLPYKSGIGILRNDTKNKSQAATMSASHLYALMLWIRNANPAVILLSVLFSIVSLVDLQRQRR